MAAPVRFGQIVAPGWHALALQTYRAWPVLCPVNGLASWLLRLHHGLSDPSLAAYILGSTEFFSRM